MFNQKLWYLLLGWYLWSSDPCRYQHKKTLCNFPDYTHPKSGEKKDKKNFIKLTATRGRELPRPISSAKMTCFLCCHANRKKFKPSSWYGCRDPATNQNPPPIHSVWCDGIFCSPFLYWFLVQIFYSETHVHWAKRRTSYLESIVTQLMQMDGWVYACLARHMRPSIFKG
jgi:hypothetical protein